MLVVSEKDGEVTFRVRVHPRASRSEVVGEHGGAIKLNLKSPPVDGKANEECVRLVAKLLGVTRSNVEILSGASSRDKTIRVRGISKELIFQMFSR